MALRYDHPNNVVRREWCGTTLVTSAVTSVPLACYQKTRLVAAHCIVSIAGTGTAADNEVYDVILNGGTAASFTMTGSSANSHQSSGATGSPLGTCTAYGVITTVKQGGAVGAANMIYEYEVLPDATQS